MPEKVKMPLMEGAVKSAQEKAKQQPPANPEPPKKGGWDDLSYYDRMAEYMYYHKFLQDELQKRMPEGVNQYKEQMKSLHDQQLTEHGQFVPYYDRKNAQQKAAMLKSKYQDQLSEEDIRKILNQVPAVDNQNPYERFRQLRNEAFDYDMGLFKREKPIEGFSLEEYLPMVSSSIEDAGKYYKPEIKDGRIVRKTNLLKPAK